MCVCVCVCVCMCVCVFCFILEFTKKKKKDLKTTAIGSLKKNRKMHKSRGEIMYSSEYNF